MKKLVLLIYLAGVLVTAATAQPPCAKYFEIGNGFSFCPPSGWSFDESASGGKLQTKFFRSPNNQPVANLSVIIEDSKLKHAEYMHSSMVSIFDNNEQKGSNGNLLTAWDTFATPSGLIGTRTVTVSLVGEKQKRVVQFTFSRDGKHVTFTGAGWEDNKVVNDKLFADAARSIRVSP